MLFSENLKIANKGYDCFGDVLNYLPIGFYKYDALSKAQYLEMRLFLSNYLLSSQGDRVAMANSLEIRLPFLDHRIIEFMSRVPSIWKILGINEKHLLKKVFQEDLPSSITSRTKQPYRAPIHHSFFNKRGKAYVTEMLSEHSVKSAGLFDSKKIYLLRKKAEIADSISEVDSMAIAGVLSTMLINYQFIENFPKAHPEKYPFNIYEDRRTHSSSLP
jgi:asparagine synthase (glutamine-hydrolysing)